jgi:hypothetical protein
MKYIGFVSWNTIKGVKGRIKGIAEYLSREEISFLPMWSPASLGWLWKREPTTNQQASERQTEPRGEEFAEEDKEEELI